MFLVIPTLTLKNNKLNECIQAANELEIAYKTLSQLPIKFCNLLRIENAKSLHIIDQDSYVNNNIDNNFELIKSISNSLDIPIQLQANFKDFEQCCKILDSGTYRLIISDLAYFQPDITKELILKYSNSKITFLLNYSNQKIKFKDGSETDCNDFLKFITSIGGNRIYFNDIESNENNYKFNELKLKEIVSNYKIKLTLIDGVYNAPQLWELQKLLNFGIDSVIIGKAFYENAFPCQNIWRIAEKKIVQELIN